VAPADSRQQSLQSETPAHKAWKDKKLRLRKNSDAIKVNSDDYSHLVQEERELMN
jgi:hypothetical protein